MNEKKTKHNIWDRTSPMNMKRFTIKCNGEWINFCFRYHCWIWLRECFRWVSFERSHTDIGRYEIKNIYIFREVVLCWLNSVWRQLHPDEFLYFSAISWTVKFFSVIFALSATYIRPYHESTTIVTFRCFASAMSFYLIQIWMTFDLIHKTSSIVAFTNKRSICWLLKFKMPKLRTLPISTNSNTLQSPCI